MLEQDIPGRDHTEQEFSQVFDDRNSDEDNLSDNDAAKDAAKISVYSEPRMGPNMVYTLIYSTKTPVRYRYMLLEKILSNLVGGHEDVNSEPYICLSYASGKCYVNSNFIGHALLYDLPTTIEDAISVTIDLGMRQLWVDQYCIDQSDEEDKMKTIQDMYLIYGGADVTIIAASGQDASAGLSGVRGTPQNIRQLISSGRHNFWLSRDITISFGSSVWNTRGWTHQGGLLSKRRLAFTDARLYYQCCEECFLEEFHPSSKDSEELNGRYLKLFPSSPNEHFWINDRLRNYFTGRLTHDSGSLNAFQGILNQSLGTRHFHGIYFNYSQHLPFIALGSFLNNMSWRIIHGAAQPRMVPEQTTTTEFPSWTWAAYKALYPNTQDQLELDHDDGRMKCYNGLAVRIPGKELARPSLGAELPSHGLTPS